MLGVKISMPNDSQTLILWYDTREHTNPLPYNFLGEMWFYLFWMHTPVQVHDLQKRIKL